MVDLSISIEGASGTTWDRMARITEIVEHSSIHRLMVSDHLVGPFPPDPPNLEAMMALAFVANRTSRVGFGTHVAPVTIRDPILLLRQAAALNDLSGGRMVLGVGAGWNAREYAMFGYPFGTAKERAVRLDEALTVMRGLLRAEAPCTFAGSTICVQDAVLTDAGIPGNMPILVGGSGPKLTLPIVARHADIWGAQMVTPEEFAERNAALNRLIVEEGREPTSVRRAVMLGILCGDDDRIAEQVRRVPILPADMSIAERRNFFTEMFHWAVGTPEVVRAWIDAYVAAGADEFIVQWFNWFGIETSEQIEHEVRLLESLAA